MKVFNSSLFFIKGSLRPLSNQIDPEKNRNPNYVEVSIIKL